MTHEKSVGEWLRDYVPSVTDLNRANCHHVTLTYAQSLDGRIAGKGRVPIAISGPVSLTLTHTLREIHDALLIGIGTFESDNPTLNCRSEHPHHPRPVILDPNFRIAITAESKVLQAASKLKGKYPIVMVKKDIADCMKEKKMRLSAMGCIIVTYHGGTTDAETWIDIFETLSRSEDINSIMVEGGAKIIQSLLSLEKALFDTLIVTVAPLYIGGDGVAIDAPEMKQELDHIQWRQFGRDVVMAAKVVRF